MGGRFNRLGIREKSVRKYPAWHEWKKHRYEQRGGPRCLQLYWPMKGRRIVVERVSFALKIAKLAGCDGHDVFGPYSCLQSYEVEDFITE